MTSHQQMTTKKFIYIYKKQKKRNFYIYIQKDKYLAKNKTICLAFLFTKSQILYVTQFHEIIGIGIYVYKKRDILR